MAEKKEKTKKRGVSYGKCETDGRIVLVGTYKGDQLKKWRGWYNYPVSGNGRDALVASDFAKINELWLFNGKKDQRNYKAQFVGVKTREELIRDYGYLAWERDGLATKDTKAGRDAPIAPRKRLPMPHGTHYALFRTELLYRHKLDMPGDADAVVIRTADFARRSPRIAIHSLGGRCVFATKWRAGA